MSLSDQAVTGAASAARSIEQCVLEIGPGFHPDTPFSEYLFLQSGQPVFDSATANKLDDLIARAFELCDPYEIGLAAIHRTFRLKSDAPPLS